MFAHGSKERLSTHDLARFSGETLFDRIARAVCAADCLPRKELYEAWEVARRLRRYVRGGRVIDVAGGHGLLAHVMLLLDDSSPDAVVIDPAIPPSAARLHVLLSETWPRLAGRVTFEARPVELGAVRPGDVIVSSHACGSLTDRVLDAALQARAPVAVLPCCHDLDTNDSGGLTGWVDGPLAIDLVRAARLREAGYQVRTQTIPAAITPKNRLLIGLPERTARYQPPA